MAYHADAQDFAFNLYCQGWSDEQIEKEMRTQWPTFTRQVLYGEGGWKKKFNWEDRRSKADAKRQELKETIEDTEGMMVKALSSAIKSLSEKIETQGSQVKAEDVAQLNKLSATLNNIRKRMESGGSYDRAAAFIDFMTKFLGFITARDPELAQSIESEYMDDFIAEVKADA